MKEKIVLSWSGGKDCALTLYELLKTEKYEIISLLTTITEDYNRISMHGVRNILLQQQVESLGFSIEKILLSKKSSNEEYEANMHKVLNKFLKENEFSVSFGDIFLEDLRKYREDKLSLLGIKGIFPLWKKDTLDLANKFIDLGFKAIITCVDSEFLEKKFVGREFNQQFLSELPLNVDPCGENGEFHSFVYNGPIFKKKIEFSRGDVVFRENRFYYCDLCPII